MMGISPDGADDPDVTTISVEQCGIWIFDIDGCIIDSLTGGSLRPGTESILVHLLRSDRTPLAWSAGGDEYARRRTAEHGIDHLFRGFHGKNGRDRSGRYRIDHLVVDVSDVVFVDDRPEDIPTGAELIGVRPYLAHNRHDRGLLPVADRAGLRRVDFIGGRSDDIIESKGSP